MPAFNPIDAAIPAGWEETEAFKVISMRVAERLRDNDEDWGLSRIEFAQRAKRVLRERFAARRKRASKPRQLVVIEQHEEPIAVSWRACGIWAYQVQRYDAVVSLPYVSILGEAA